MRSTELQRRLTWSCNSLARVPLAASFPTVGAAGRWVLIGRTLWGQSGCRSLMLAALRTANQRGDLDGQCFSILSNTRPIGLVLRPTAPPLEGRGQPRGDSAGTQRLSRRECNCLVAWHGLPACLASSVCRPLDFVPGSRPGRFTPSWACSSVVRAGDS